MSVLTGCPPRTVIVPDDREIIIDEDGRYCLSPGYLREIFRECGIKEDGR